MLQYAAHAVESGQAEVVACLYADAPLTEGGSISQSAYGGTPPVTPGLSHAPSSSCTSLRRAQISL